MGDGKIPSFLVCKSCHTWDRSETIRSHLIKKPQPSNSRLQRILIRTFPYNFTVCYIPDITNQLANCLSRLGDQNNTIKLPKLHVFQITQQLPARSDILHQLRVSTQADDELALLKHTIMQGWPSAIKQVSPVLHPYWTFREELTVEDGLIMKDTRVVVPNKQCKAILKLIHRGHLGLNKCKLQAKETVYLPGLNDQLEKHVFNCQLCLKYLNSKHKQEPSLSLGQEVPLYPWTKLQQTFSTLRESPTYLLLTIPAGFQLCTSLHQWLVNTLQVTSRSYVLNMDDQKLWFRQWAMLYIWSGIAHH